MFFKVINLENASLFKAYLREVIFLLGFLPYSLLLDDLESNRDSFYLITTELGSPLALVELEPVGDVVILHGVVRQDVRYRLNYRAALSTVLLKLIFKLVFEIYQKKAILIFDEPYHGFKGFVRRWGLKARMLGKQKVYVLTPLMLFSTAENV